MIPLPPTWINNLFGNSLMLKEEMYRQVIYAINMKSEEVISQWLNVLMLEERLLEFSHNQRWLK